MTETWLGNKKINIEKRLYLGHGTAGGKLRKLRQPKNITRVAREERTRKGKKAAHRDITRGTER